MVPMFHAVFQACHGEYRPGRRLESEDRERARRARHEKCMIHYFPVICTFDHMSVDSQVLPRTIPDRGTPVGHPVLTIHWARVFSSSVLEEGTPRKRGTARNSNMNPKNIGSYKEGEGEEE